MERFPYLNFVFHDVSQPKEWQLLQEFVLKSGIDAGRLGSPITFIKDGYVSDKLIQKIEGYAIH